uniref:Uncharacterized protein LOC113798270 n=1 Tax=Dermatophagoides pteronyssinus TaxID=6956 RepID=A0A6P6YI95_DERPT|nr:uncharacterized protein LOC113798270 [Dermatophagoides pteronyssinus]
MSFFDRNHRILNETHQNSQTVHLMNGNLQLILILSMIILMLIILISFAMLIRRNVWLQSSKLFQRNPGIHQQYPSTDNHNNNGHHYLNPYQRHYYSRNSHRLSLYPLSSSPLSSLSSDINPSTLYCSPSSATIFNLFTPPPPQQRSLSSYRPFSMTRFNQSTATANNHQSLIIDDVDDNLQRQRQQQPPPSYSEVVLVDDDNDQQLNQQKSNEKIADNVKVEIKTLSSSSLPPLPSYQELKFI